MVGLHTGAGMRDVVLLGEPQRRRGFAEGVWAQQLRREAAAAVAAVAAGAEHVEALLGRPGKPGRRVELGRQQPEVWRMQSRRPEEVRRRWGRAAGRAGDPHSRTGGVQGGLRLRRQGGGRQWRWGGRRDGTLWMCRCQRREAGNLEAWLRKRKQEVSKERHSLSILRIFRA